jgi:tetratricopeptide (TPR) repeat protein
MNGSTEILLPVLLVVFVPLACLIEWWLSKKKKPPTIKCQLCDYVGPANGRWRPFHGRTPVCKQCDSDNVLVVKVAEASPGNTTIVWADGRHCPACHVDIGFWPIVKAGLPHRIRCPKCGLGLKYVDSGAIVVTILVLPTALVLATFMSVSWLTPWALLPPIIATVICLLLSAGLALPFPAFEFALAQYLRGQKVLIKAQDDVASADYLTDRTRRDIVSGAEQAGTTYRVGRRRRWLWGSAAILAGVILWTVCGIIWYQHAQQVKKEARIHYSQAVATANRGEPDKAIVELTEAIRLDPRLVEALVSRAHYYVSKHESDKAMADCTEAIRVDPKHATAYEFRAVVHNIKGDHDKAIADTNEAIRLDPKLADAYLVQGIAYVEKDELDKAIDDFTSAIHLDPKSEMAYCARGRTYTREGELSKAIADYTEAIGRDPKYVLAYCERSVVHRRKGQLDEAMADCMEALRIDPKRALAYSRRAAIHNSKGEYDQAIIDSNEALRLDPKLHVAFADRGIAYSKKGEFGKATADFAEALRIYPKLAAAYYGKGSSYIDKVVRDAKGHSNVGKSEYAKAVADLSEAIKIDSGNPDAYEKRAFAYRALGEEAKALSDENKAKQLRK